jgi:hypothetical protein
MTDVNPPQKSVETTWARPIDRLKVPEMPSEATNLNVEGRRVTGPLQGFGQLWQKTFRVRLPGIEQTPIEVLKTWKEGFPKFHAQENRFYPSKTGIVPGEVLLINAMTPGGPVSTGMLVLYVDDESFTLMTPEGHPESGWVTFSTYNENNTVVAQVQTMARANDPIYELAFMTIGTHLQDSIWENVLKNLAAHYRLQGQVTAQKTLVDPKRQWSRVKNVWYNAQIRTIFYSLGAPFRWVGKKLGREQ